MLVELSISGDEDAALRIELYGKRGRDVRPALMAIDEDIRHMLKRQFDSEGQFRSHGWERLKQSTVLAKQRHKPPLDPRILHATLALEKSLTERGAPGGVDHVSDDEVVVGTSVFYAKFHHSKRPRHSNLPRRPLLEFTLEDTKRFAKTLQAYIAGSRVRHY